MSATRLLPSREPTRIPVLVWDTVSTPAHSLSPVKPVEEGGQLSDQDVEQAPRKKLTILLSQYILSDGEFAIQVGADLPAKCQKMMSHVIHWQAGSVLCIRRMGLGTSFPSRQRDIIACFSVGTSTVQTCLETYKIQRICIKYFYHF